MPPGAIHEVALIDRLSPTLALTLGSKSHPRKRLRMPTIQFQLHYASEGLPHTFANRESDQNPPYYNAEPFRKQLSYYYASQVIMTYTHVTLLC